MKGSMQPLAALCALAPDQAEALGLRHTPREIVQQPRLWLDTLDRVRRDRDVPGFLQSAGLGTASPPEVVLIGAGSSDFVAQLVAPAFRARFQTPAQALASTDLLTQTASLLHAKRRYLFVWFSRSGTTAEAVELLGRLEREMESAHHLFITCNAASVFARRPPSARSRCLILDDAACDRGLAMTSSFTSMALAGLLLASGATEASSVAVADLARAAERLFDHVGPALSHLAQRGNTSACFLGSGALKVAAGESALKLLELTAGRVKTRFDSFLGVRHGPLASLDQDTTLVGFLSRSPAERLVELELVREVQDKALCGAVALVSPEPEPSAGELSDYVIDLELPSRLSDAFRPLLDVVVGQLLALWSALARGVRPDTPSPNGAIQRVVTRIRPAAAGERSP